jgi:nitrate/nitrite-specific signal transduction histidine kinase
MPFLNAFGRSILPILLMTIASGLMAAVSEQNWAAAINVAGRQRMLSQKMTKELILARFGIEADAQRKLMQASIKQFTESHRRLSAGDAEQGIPVPPTPEVQAALLAIDKPWAEFSAALAAADKDADVASLTALASGNEALLKSVAAMVEIYEQAQKAAMGTASGKVINWAGRQRMLSQRMAKEALLIAAGADVEAATKRLAAARKLFGEAHTALAQGDATAGIPTPTDPVVQKQFVKVGALWERYQTVLDKVAAGDAAARTELAEISTQMLVETNRATTLLEGQVR